MEEKHLELKEYSHKDRNQKIVEYLNSLNKKEIRKILTEEFKGYKNYFHFAVLFNYVDIAKIFLKHDPDIVGDSLFKYPETLLRYVVTNYLIEMTCTFLQYNKKQINFNDLLRTVIFYNNKDVIMFVIKKTTCNVSLEVMLRLAALFGRPQIVEILLGYKWLRPGWTESESRALF